MEIKNKIKEITKRIEELEIERSRLKLDLIKESGFKSGDKVHIEFLTWNEKKEEHDAFISRIYVDNDAELDFVFVKVKKDGTMSKQELFHYNRNLKIKKI